LGQLPGAIQEIFSKSKGVRRRISAPPPISPQTPTAKVQATFLANLNKEKKKQEGKKRKKDTETEEHKRTTKKQKPNSTKKKQSQRKTR
jgi:hypothetical protein